MSLNLARALSIVLLIATPAAAMAQSGPRQQQDRDQQQRQQQSRQQQPQAQQQRPQATPNRQAQRQPTRGSYGTWNQSWGARPSAPPKHWTRTSDWYRHVRACQQRYRSYNPRTDTYRANSGQNRRCTL